MKLQFKRWGFLLLIIILAEVALSRQFLRPKKKELAGLAGRYNAWNTELTEVSKKIEERTEQLQRLERELSSPIAEAKLELAEGIEVPTFLEYISRLVWSLRIKYISIELNPLAASSHQTSYKIKINSEYSKLVRLVDNLENQLNLGIENLSIKAGEEVPDLHEATFNLSFLKMREDKGLPAEPEKLDTVLKLAKVFSKKKVRKDPFFHRVIPKTFEKGTAARPKQEPLVLRGIMDVMGQKAALINQHILREGDKIKGYRLLKISQNKVVLLRRKQRYVLNLRGLTSIENAGI